MVDAKRLRMCPLPLALSLRQPGRSPRERDLFVGVADCARAGGGGFAGRGTSTGGAAIEAGGQAAATGNGEEGSESRRSGTQDEDVPMADLLDSVKWLLPNSAKLLREHLAWWRAAAWLVGWRSPTPAGDERRCWWW